MSISPCFPGVLFTHGTNEAHFSSPDRGRSCKGLKTVVTLRRLDPGCGREVCVFQPTVGGAVLAFSLSLVSHPITSASGDTSATGKLPGSWDGGDPANPPETEPPPPRPSGAALRAEACPSPSRTSVSVFLAAFDKQNHFKEEKQKLGETQYSCYGLFEKCAFNATAKMLGKCV